MSTRFDRDTAVERVGDSHFRTTISGDWSAPRGPNGGYIAASVVRALAAAVDDPARAARSLTLHYMRPPQPGPADIHVTVERAGRRVSTLSFRMVQTGSACVLGVGAFGVDFPAEMDYADAAPAFAAPETVEPWPLHPEMPPIASRIVCRPVVGDLPFSGSGRGLTGGWLSLRDEAPRVLDAPALAFYADAWLPAPFPRMTGPVAAPTIDLTIHFRAPGIECLDPVLGVFSSRVSRAGYFEEDGELWSADGVLLAQSRQLALLVAMG